MSATPRMITADITIRWDGTPQRLGRRTVLDVPEGSAFEAAIGRENLATLSGLPLIGAEPEPAPVQEPEPEPAQPAAKPKARTAASDDSAAGQAPDGAQDAPGDAGGGDQM
jgi:hypothetical protein